MEKIRLTVGNWCNGDFSPTDAPAGHVGLYGCKQGSSFRRCAGWLVSGKLGLKFKEYDVVALKREVPGIPLPVSTSGTVLMIYPDSPMHYEVEFSDGEGNFYPGTYTVSEDDLTLIWEYDGR
jgi:hypothetical protein